VPFEVQPSGVPELERGVPEEVAVENALRKAQAVAATRRAGELVLGVDTLVTLDGVIYGKPRDEAHARATLCALSGATHRVMSGVALVRGGDGAPADEQHTAAQAAHEGGGEARTALAITEVSFRDLDDVLLEWYVALGEWRDRSGGYAIQKGGSLLVREVHGDYENVVGLPLATLLDLHPALLQQLG
jgi:septum formation protein